MEDVAEEDMLEVCRRDDCDAWPAGAMDIDDEIVGFDTEAASVVAELCETLDEKAANNDDVVNPAEVVEAIPEPLYGMLDGTDTCSGVEEVFVAAIDDEGTLSDAITVCIRVELIFRNKVAVSAQDFDTEDVQLFRTGGELPYVLFADCVALNCDAETVKFVSKRAAIIFSLRTGSP
jgi:hypothetical protein